MFDGNGILLATKSRGIKYCYDINILKLPRQLRKFLKNLEEQLKESILKKIGKNFYSVYIECLI